jgi:hypothetical protein
MAMTIVDLRLDAIAEAERLTSARRLLRDRDERALDRLEGDATWIATCRRTAVRRSLGGRVCLIWRLAFEDASGRLVESKLVPVLVAAPRSAVRRSSASMASFVQHVSDLVRPRVEAECEAWRAEVMRLAGAFAAAQTQREREIAARPERSRGDFQGGLFDRRAERSRDIHAAAVAESESAAAARLRAIRAAVQITQPPSRLLLILMP